MATISRRRYQKSLVQSWIKELVSSFEHTDLSLLIATFALVAVGLMMVYSSSLYVGLIYKGNPNHYFFRQLLAVCLGLAGMVVIQLFPYKLYRNFSTYLMVGILILLVLVLFVGETINGARRGFFGGSLQPAEFAKLVIVIYMADWLSSKGERLGDVNLGLVPFWFLVGLVGGTVAAQPDISTAILIALIAFSMYYVAGAKLSHFIITALVGLGAFYFLIQKMPHSSGRVINFWTLWTNFDQADWQVKQTLYALARGGVLGQGLGNSFQKLGLLPVPHSDGILAIIGEEMGLVGSLGVLSLLFFIAYRGYKIASEAEDTYSRLLALGITSWLILQTLINAAVNTGLLPFTGMPLPFISSGGSSMVALLCGIGVLLNVAQQNKRLAAGTAKRDSSRQGALRRKNASDRVGRRDRRTYFSRPGYRR